jgi:hypothetical protein
MSLTYEKILAEDLDLGYGTRVVSNPAGGSMSGNKIGIHTFSPGMVHVKDYGANGSGDDSAHIQAAIDAMSTDGGGVVLLGAKTYYANIIIKSYVTLRGIRGKTTLTPFTDAPVIKVSATDSTANFTLEDFNISGNLAFTSQDGINLEPAAANTFVESAVFRNMLIEHCGRYGIRMVGTGVGAAGAFVQHVRMETVVSQDNTNSALSIEGDVLETLGTQVTTSNSSAGNGVLEIISLNNAGLICPARTTFVGSIHNSSTSYTASGNIPAILIDDAREVSFRGFDVESADPMVSIVGTNQQNYLINFDVGNFSLNGDATSIVSVDYCNGLKINARFTQSGGTVTSAIDFLTGSAANVTNYSRAGSTFNGTFTNIENNVGNYYYAIASGVLPAYRPMLNAHAETGTTDDLATIQDIYGGTKKLEDGQMITILQFPGDVITIKHGTGNIITSTAADYALVDSGTSSITLRWTDKFAKWLELGRTA